MKKLEIELYRYENLVFGKVIYQDESLRNKGTIEKKDDFKIESRLVPDLEENRLYIRGAREKQDNTVFSYQFLDSETAIKTCGKIKECVDSINCEVKMPSLERII